MIKEFAEKHNLLWGITTKEKYETHTKLNDRYAYAKSIITFAMPIKRGSGMVASYALETDYHIVLKKLLEELAIHMELEHYDICVDNSPISDKLCAVTSGIGFIGKNSLVISEIGSYIMLGEIITELEIEPTLEASGTCGSCTKCAEACPSGAIGNIYESCIAGWLQRKIPLEDWQYELFDTIYGCDICQDVCPYNKKVEKGTSFRYENIDIFDIMKCSKKEFYKYNEYAFYWLGHNVMKRNIIVYAKNKGINIDHLLQYVHSKEEYMTKAIEYYWRR